MLFLQFGTLASIFICSLTVAFAFLLVLLLSLVLIEYVIKYLIYLWLHLANLFNFVIICMIK